jgi:hypothetical protein
VAPTSGATGHVAHNPRGQAGKVARAPGGTTGHVAHVPSGTPGHVAKAPNGPAGYVATNPRSPVSTPVSTPAGISSDAGNILELGSDGKLYLSCETIDDCGLFEEAGAVAAHVAETHPHAQYILVGSRIVGREITF